MNTQVYDLAAIGIGPFNLGLAALSHPIKELKTIFFEKSAAFNWHPGMLIPGTTLQVSYLSDLVTMVNPASPFSYLNFLRQQNRLLQFGIREAKHITRTEYNRYCGWVCGELENLRFNHTVTAIDYHAETGTFLIHCDKAKGGSSVYCVKRIVIGIGTVPSMPACASEISSGNIFHSSNYLFSKKEIHEAKDIAIIGSGQSAAEIALDLLCNHPEKRLHWFTPSDRLYAMEDHKMVFEMNTPDYINHFYELAQQRKDNLLQSQHTLYKGINQSLLNSIYDKLYEQFTESGAPSAIIQTGISLKNIEALENDRQRLVLHHNRLNRLFSQETDCVILATGYRYQLPDFIGPIKDKISWLPAQRYKVNWDYSIDTDHSIFIQNAEIHSHGFNAPDLSLGPYRNAVIINSILGRAFYPIDRGVTFQQFEREQA